MLPPPLFIAAHPDDEIWMAVAIAEYVHAGQDVHLLYLTAGTASGVIRDLNGTKTNTWWRVLHDPAAEGYQPLTPESLGAARLREVHTAARCLAAGLTGTLTVHGAGLQDGAVTRSAAYGAIADVADQVGTGGPVRIKTHTDVADAHPDHLVAGEAARQLKADHPDRFDDARFYVQPANWSHPALGQVSEAWDWPATTEIADRVRNAVRCYQAWAPQAGSYAIGYHSVPQLLDQIAATPKCLFHA